MSKKVNTIKQFYCNDNQFTKSERCEMQCKTCLEMDKISSNNTEVDKIIDSFCNIRPNLAGILFYRLELRTNEKVQALKDKLNEVFSLNKIEYDFYCSGESDSCLKKCNEQCYGCEDIEEERKLNNM